MSRMPVVDTPHYLGFDEMDQASVRQPKAAHDGYPPYNIALVKNRGGNAARIHITLAVAGFGADELNVTLQGNQLTIAGAQDDDSSRTFLHRGIAARQFQRHFILAAGIEVQYAKLHNGLLSVALVRPKVDPTKKRIAIETPGEAT